MPPIQEKVEQLVDFIRLGVGWDLGVGNIHQEEEQEDDGDAEDSGDDESSSNDEEVDDDSAWEDESVWEDESEDEALNFAKDIDNSVRCLMDLIPSMEQVKASRGRKDWNHLTGTK
jgi:TATA-binding protein-associated factor Taf7